MIKKFLLRLDVFLDKHWQRTHKDIINLLNKMKWGK